MPIITRKARVITPGFRWALQCKFKPQDGVTEVFPVAATYEAQIRNREESPNILHTMTTANGGIVRVDALTIAFVLSAAETAAIKAASDAGAKAIEFDIARTDTPDREYVGIRVRIPFKNTITR